MAKVNDPGKGKNNDQAHEENVSRTLAPHERQQAHQRGQTTTPVDPNKYTGRSDNR